MNTRSVYTYCTSGVISFSFLFPSQSQIYMMEQEKRRMHLEVGKLNLQRQNSEKIVQELQFLIREEKRKRKKERKRKVCRTCVESGWVGGGVMSLH